MNDDGGTVELVLVIDYFQKKKFLVFMYSAFGNSCHAFRFAFLIRKIQTIQKIENTSSLPLSAI
jgi:hypothetical protein